MLWEHCVFFPNMPTSTPSTVKWPYIQNGHTQTSMHSHAHFPSQVSIGFSWLRQLVQNPTLMGAWQPQKYSIELWTMQGLETFVVITLTKGWFPWHSTYPLASWNAWKPWQHFSFFYVIYIHIAIADSCKTILFIPRATTVAVISFPYPSKGKTQYARLWCVEMQQHDMVLLLDRAMTAKEQKKKNSNNSTFYWSKSKKTQ